MIDIAGVTRPVLVARKTLGLSQQAVARKLGMRQGQISDIEAGKHDLRLSTLVEVARAVGLELVLVPRSLLPAVSYLSQSTDPSREGKQQSMYESWDEEGAQSSGGR
jgi:HTH-type transcriptional regulator / antitoxin HipB